MVFPLYAFVLVGLALLVGDVLGLLRASTARTRWWRIIGLVAAAGPGLAPIIAWLTGRLASEGWVFPAVSAGYLLSYLLWVAGVAGRLGAASVLARRTAYAVILALASIPSWVLLVLTPLVAIAGLALVQPTDPPG
jgi:hypothetical protein